MIQNKRLLSLPGAVTPDIARHDVLLTDVKQGGGDREHVGRNDELPLREDKNIWPVASLEIENKKNFSVFLWALSHAHDNIKAC